jgi:hypothetical protein
VTCCPAGGNDDKGRCQALDDVHPRHHFRCKWKGSQWVLREISLSAEGCMAWR